jgi:hypothetical protein
MDLSRIDLITRDTDEDVLETLIPKLGFNDENVHEQPRMVLDNTGGLKIWQYPNQFSKYMARILAAYPITRYLEIGCRWGGTFVLTMEYLKRVGNEGAEVEGVAVDIIDSPVQEYCAEYPNARFVKCDSSSPEFEKFLETERFDLVLIDGDHSYEGVKGDFNRVRDKARSLVFHDIRSTACPGVVQCWNEVKETYANDYEFHEFVEQYDEITTTGNTYLGIGVAVPLVW